MSARRWLIAAVAATVVVLAVLVLRPAPQTVLPTTAMPAAPVPVTLAADRTPHCFALEAVPATAARVEFATTSTTALRAVELTQPGHEARALSPTKASTDGRAAYRLPDGIAAGTTGIAVCPIPSGRETTLLGEGETPAFWLTSAGNGTWLGKIGTLVDRAGIGRGTLGAAALPLAAILVLAAWALVIAIVAGALRAPSERITRRAVLGLGLAATCWAGAFAVTTPAFQAPDEMVHLQYVELLRVKHKLPTESRELPDTYSSQMRTALDALRVGSVAFRGDARGVWDPSANGPIERRIDSARLDDFRDSFTNASSQPPLYYLSALPLEAAVGGSILDRMLVVRLWSALMMGVAVAFGVAFVRELLRGSGALAAAAGGVLASFPLIGFIGGSVNPDAALTLASAAALWATAVILRRGLTVGRGIGLGLIVGLGVLSKLTFAGLLPGVAVAVLLAGWWAWRAGRRRDAIGGVIGAGATAAIVALPYVGWAIGSGRGLLISSPDAPPASPVAIREWLTYTVELFAGQFGPIADRIPGSGPIDIWGTGLVGRFGWLDYGFSKTIVIVVMIAWGLAAVVALLRLALRLVGGPERIRTALIAAVLALCTIGLMLMISRAGLVARHTGAIGFEQARYLLPIAPLGAAGLAYAAGALGRLRWHAGAVLVALGLLHGTAAWMLTIARYFA